MARVRTYAQENEWLHSERQTSPATIHRYQRPTKTWTTLDEPELIRRHLLIDISSEDDRTSSEEEMEPDLGYNFYMVKKRKASNMVLEPLVKFWLCGSKIRPPRPGHLINYDDAECRPHFLNVEVVWLKPKCNDLEKLETERATYTIGIKTFVVETKNMKRIPAEAISQVGNVVQIDTSCIKALWMQK